MLKSHNNNYIITRNNRTDIKQLLIDETIFSLSNGRFGTRGQFAEGYGTNHFPVTIYNGTYFEYDYHYEESFPGLPKKGQSIINLPDTSYIQIVTSDGDINLSQAQLTNLERTYDLKQGYTTRIASYVTKSGYNFEVKETKLVSSIDDISVQKLEVSSTNYTGDISLISHLRFPINSNFDRTDPRLPNIKQKLNFVSLSLSLNSASLCTQIKNRPDNFIVASITHDKPCTMSEDGHNAYATYTSKLSPNKSVELTKYSYYSNHNLHTVDKLQSIVAPIDQYIEQEALSMDKLWSNFDITLDDSKMQSILRYNAMQLYRQSINNTSAIAAKGTSGEGYDGHYFWDTEIFMLPFFIITNADKAKDFLLFRYKHLNKAKQEALKLGIKRGVKIPWRTINGTESSSNFLAGSAEVHINSDLAYAIKTYYNATDDIEFMYDYGVEMLLQTALFLLDYGNFDNNGKFHLCQVTGPDEYTMLEDDNYYTNLQAQQHFLYTVDFVNQHKDKLVKLLKTLDITDTTLQQLYNAGVNMTLLIDKDKNIIKQDASFLNKKHLDLSLLTHKDYPLFLHNHPQYLCQHQVQKQADVVLANVLFDPTYSDLNSNTFDYYLSRTVHDSSLSECVYSINAYNLSKLDMAYTLFKSSLLYDFTNKDNFTRYGLHFANLGGSILMVMYGLLGIRLDNNLTLNPSYQQDFKTVGIKFVYKGASINVSVKDTTCTISSTKPITVNIYGKVQSIKNSYSFNIIKY